MPDRTKGMSVILISNTAPHARILVLGGSDSSTNNTYELIDASRPVEEIADDVVERMVGR